MNLDFFDLHNKPLGIKTMCKVEFSMCSTLEGAFIGTGKGCFLWLVVYSQDHVDQKQGFRQYFVSRRRSQGKQI